MAFLETVRALSLSRVLNVIMIVVPYLDQEVLGVIPGVRSYAPGPTIRLTRLSWTERVRWLLLVIAPLVDGEIIELLTGRDALDVIES